MIWSMISALMLAGVALTTNSWDVRSKTDTMTDIVSLSATKRGDHGLLAISCKKGDKESVSVLVGADNFFNTSRVHAAQLVYRFDTEKAVDDTWVYSRSAAMLTSTEQSADFLISMLKAKRLRIRMTSAAGDSREIEFNVEGFVPATIDMFRECGVRS